MLRCATRDCPRIRYRRSTAGHCRSCVAAGADVLSVKLARLAEPVRPKKPGKGMTGHGWTDEKLEEFFAQNR